jgi:hypothetical protein
LKLALEVFELFEKIDNPLLIIKRVDVSNAFDQSFGKREIVIQLEHILSIPRKERQISCVFPRTLRVCVKDYETQLSNYLSLHNQMIKDYLKQLKLASNTPPYLRFSSKVIDMRILKLAFIDE